MCKRDYSSSSERNLADQKSIEKYMSHQSTAGHCCFGHLHLPKRSLACLHAKRCSPCSVAVARKAISDASECEDGLTAFCNVLVGLPAYSLLCSRTARNRQLEHPCGTRTPPRLVYFKPDLRAILSFKEEHDSIFPLVFKLGTDDARSDDTGRFVAKVANKQPPFECSMGIGRQRSQA